MPILPYPRPAVALCLVLGCLSVLASCDDDFQSDVSDVAIFVTPTAAQRVSLHSGEYFRYAIDLHAKAGDVGRLAVASFDAEYGHQPLLDTTLQAGVATFDYVYVAPPARTDSLVVRLTFRAWDAAGHVGETERTILVRGRALLADELSGIVLWDGRTGRPSALSYGAPTQTFCHLASPDSVRADLVAVYDDASGQFGLSSLTGGKFIRSNNFDYPAATSGSITAVYASSRREDRVDALQLNDIILVGHGDVAEGVFSITAIDTGSESTRSVRLAFKGVRAL